MRATHKREIAPYLGNKLLPEISTEKIIKERGAPSTVILTRDLFHAVYKEAILKGHKIKNPAESISSISSVSIKIFRPRVKVLSPREIHVFSKN